jgi:hypothetical protein
MRALAMHGLPPQVSGFAVMRDKWAAMFKPSAAIHQKAMNLWQLHCISDDDPVSLGRYDTVSLSRLTACAFQFDAVALRPFCLIA